MPCFFSPPASASLLYFCGGFNDDRPRHARSGGRTVKTPTTLMELAEAMDIVMLAHTIQRDALQDDETGREARTAMAATANAWFVAGAMVRRLAERMEDDNAGK